MLTTAVWLVDEGSLYNMVLDFTDWQSILNTWLGNVKFIPFQAATDSKTVPVSRFLPVIFVTPGERVQCDT